LLVDSNIGIGVLPHVQESLVRLPRSGFVAHHLLRAAELEAGQWTGDIFPAQTGIVDQLLKLACGRSAIA
jgi:hypothetical protein